MRTAPRSPSVIATAWPSPPASARTSCNARRISASESMGRCSSSAASWMLILTSAGWASTTRGSAPARVSTAVGTPFVVGGGDQLGVAVDGRAGRHRARQRQPGCLGQQTQHDLAHRLPLAGLRDSLLVELRQAARLPIGHGEARAGLAAAPGEVAVDALVGQRLGDPAAGVPGQQAGHHRRCVERRRHLGDMDPLAAGELHEVLGPVDLAGGETLDLEQLVDRRIAGQAEDHALTVGPERTSEVLARLRRSAYTARPACRAWN